ncbi:hypothetical protein, partial [Nitratireductor sp. GCM10026969]|uniref:hypothetical protein n=1 Tax=Nitratireductor sp. GCM10026969 TaxID=3252645 RepID=UPI00360C8B14
MAGRKKRGYVPRNLKKDPWPVFDYACPPRGPDEPEASYARRREDAETYNESCGVYLGLFQDMLTYYGHHRTCRVRLCRRKRRCTGRRDPHDRALMLGIFVPPCIPLDDEVIAPLKAEVDSALKAYAAASAEA